MKAIPFLVKKLVFPLTLFAGRLMGQHKKFDTAPEAVSANLRGSEEPGYVR